MRSEKLNVLQFLTLLAIGGTERQVLNLVRGLDTARYRVEVACLKRWGDLLPEMEATGVPITEYRTTSLYNHVAVWNQMKFLRHLRKGRVDIVHTYGFYSNVFALAPARLAGAAAVLASIRDTGEHQTPMQKRTEKLFCRMADCIVTNAEAVRKRLTDEGYDAEKIVVIHNGIELTRYNRKPAELGLHRELGVAPTTPLVGVFARLNELKGIEYFLRAAAGLIERFPLVRFVIVGDGASRPELEKRVADLGLSKHVVFLGFRLDVPTLLSEISVSVLPTLSEGLSNSLLEAMAASVPVVATRVGGNPEVVEGGVTGLLVPPRDAEALGQAIGQFLDQPSLGTKFGLAGRERVSKRFAVEQMTQTTQRLYERLAERSGKVPHRVAS
jgi:glycosyltransferase involved in cell wall biosynthesis